MRVTIIDKRSGQAKTMEARFAKILVAMGKAEYAVEPSPLEAFATVDEWAAQPAYQTRHMEATTPRRGRPPGSKNKNKESNA